MSIMEDASRMRSRGMSNGEIIKSLQDNGASPKTINDALNQLDIKKAVSNESAQYGNNQYEQEQPQEECNNQRGYQRTQEVPESDTYLPQQQEEVYDGYPNQQQGGEYDYQSSGIDTSTVIEISEQVFSEKMQSIQKKIDEVSEFKVLSESKLEHLNEGLKKIESIIDNLQVTILEKVGGYGHGIESIKKEMSMMQDSFGKLAGRETIPKRQKTDAKKLSQKGKESR